MNYKVVVGGTFDLFHKGHKRMIKKAIKNGNSVVGITSDEMANKERKRDVNSFEHRKKVVEKFCQKCKNNFGNDYKIKKITSPEGEVVYDKNINTIVVSPEAKTIERVKNINTKRDKKGFTPLNIKVVGTIRSQDGKKISSTRIHKGEIDRKGDLIGNTAVINDIHYGFRDEINEAILEKVKEVLEPFQNVIVNGDLIHDSGSEEDLKNFRKAWEFIEKHVKNAYFTPGNHDIVNIKIDKIENIVGHKIPAKIEINGENIILIDSCSQIDIENIGFVSKDSIEMINNLNQESYIISHFPLEYTDKYQKSRFFGDYPEAVFPINKSDVNLNNKNIKKKIYAHLHMDDIDLKEKNATIRSPLLNIKSTESDKREAEPQNSTFVIK